MVAALACPSVECHDRSMPRFDVDTGREEDGRWIAEIAALPGALAYGATRDEAVRKVEALALRVIADRLEHGEPAPDVSELFVVAA